MDTAREGMSLVRPDGTFSFVNSAFANLFGYKCHQLREKHWTVLYPNKEAKRLEDDILPAVRETGYWSGETVRLTKHGEPRVTDHRFALTDEDVILCTATDITLDRTATQSSAGNFDNIADDMEDSTFFTLDHEGYVTRWNDEAKHLKGYEPPEILGKHVSTFFSHEDQEQGLPEQLLEAAKREGTATDEGWRVRNDGTQFWADLTLIASYDDAGTIQGFRTMIRDTPEKTRKFVTRW
jgi:PAS domain S-box-containing protein